ncbi:unnamed protein product, partial [Hapterophycus canaliculatus]
HPLTANSQPLTNPPIRTQFKKNKDNNKLRREMEAASRRLRDFQGEKVAYSYLNQFTSPARGRALTGLGQVDVEKVLEQIRQGNTRAETVIRGQHEQLTGSIDREQKAKRELRKTKLENETAVLELQHVRNRLIKAKKEAYRLEKALAKTTSVTNSDGEGPRGKGRGGAPTRPSAEALLGDWVAEERPSKNGGQRTWALSRRSVNGEAFGSNKEQKRPAPIGVGSTKRPRTKHAEDNQEDDLVSLGSDENGSNDSSDDDGDHSIHANDDGDLGRKRPGASLSSMMNPVAPSRSFLTSAAAKAGAGAGALRNRKPAK